MMTPAQRTKLAEMSDTQLADAMERAERLGHRRMFWRYYFENAVRSMSKQVTADVEEKPNDN